MTNLQETYAIQVIKQQCKALETKGFNCIFVEQEGQARKLNPIYVLVYKWTKCYKFSDPDLNIIMQQLCQLMTTHQVKELLKDEETNHKN